MKQTVKNFKDAFEKAVSIYDALAAGQIVPEKDEDRAIRQLQEAFQAFCDALYLVLEQYTDWHIQTKVIYESIRKEIDNDRMFGDEFRRNNCAASLDCLRIFGVIKTACWWFEDDLLYRLRGFQGRYKCSKLGVHNNVAAPASGVRTSPAAISRSQPETEMPQEKNEKGASRRQRVALLYNIFVRSGITQVKSDTDTARIINFITGGDPKVPAKNTYAAKCLHDKLYADTEKLLNDFLPRE